MGWQLWAVVSTIAAGVTAVFAKLGLEDVPSHLGNTVRTAIVLALSVFVLFVSGEHQRANTLSGRAWLFLALSGIATAVSWIAYFKALSMGSATPVTAIDKASLVVTMILGIILLGERMNWRTSLGVAMIVVGAIIASAKSE
jgi:transporter family protein